MFAHFPGALIEICAPHKCGPNRAKVGQSEKIVPPGSVAWAARFAMRFRDTLDCRIWLRFDRFMGGLKTFCLTLLAWPVAAQAEPVDLVATFAACAGRLSAELEHAWLVQTDRVDTIAAQRDAFADLLDAATPDHRSIGAMSLRIEAKAAHGDLLGRAAFSPDADLSGWAARRAQAEIDHCRSFLLKS